MSALLRRASEKVDVRFVLELRRVRDAGNATRPLLLKWKRGDKASGATKPYEASFSSFYMFKRKVHCLLSR